MSSLQTTLSRHPLSSILCPPPPSPAAPLPVKHRQIPVGHLEDDQAHGGRVVRAALAGPRAVCAILAGDELVADSRVIGRPVFAAREEHRLAGVVMAVEIVAFVVGAVAGPGGLEVVAA